MKTKTIFLLIFIQLSFFSFSQENAENINSKATETVINYLSSKTWLERSKYVIQLPKTLELMEEYYEESNFEKSLKDTTSYLYNMWFNFQKNSDPWLNIKGAPNYYKKKLTVTYGATKTEKSSEYNVKNVNGKFLIDWESSVNISDVTVEGFDSRKKKEYVMMRVYMKIYDNWLKKDDLPDYFAVSFNQEGDELAQQAIIYKKNESGMKLYDQLIDGKWLKKVIWIKYFDCISKQQDSRNETIQDQRLIGYTNSVEYNNWIIDNNQAGEVLRVNVEDPNLLKEIKKYESYLKAEELITNPPLKIKVLNSARIEYYDKQVIIYGYIDLDDYYNYGYNNSQATHYSFKLKDKNYESVQIYMNKLNSKKLFDQLTNDKDLAVKITGIPYKNKQIDNFSSILIEGISFEILK